MLKILQSNRLEILASQLSDDMGHLAASSAFSFAADTVIVPNPGVARWLWLYLAREHGISANLDCVLPGSFIWRVFHRLLPDVPERSPYEPDVMTWRLHRLLLEIQGDPAFSGLLDWRDTSDDRLRFELAQRLARLFDQYIIFRPDWIEQWRQNPASGQGWQQRLWRRLAEETAQPDWMGLRRDLDSLDPGRVRERMPDRVSVFCIPLLSPGYMEVLTWLGTHIDVCLYLPNPCCEHWGDIVAERDFGRLAGVADEKTLYIQSGNALLASWGGQARDFLDLIQELEPGISETQFAAPGSDTLLHALQTHILELRNPVAGDKPGEDLAQDDRSIQVHVCHSPTRELEVLHDQLLALFDNDPSLSASDVVVMTPDVNTYAPYIDAVFATHDRIPFNVADIDPRLGMPLIESFMSLFNLSQDRFDANHVLAILDIPAVQRRFGLAESELRQIHDWIRETGVRWGLDADSRAEFGRDDGGLHSWRHGLDRLLLGFALPGERTGTFAGVLPYDNVEGSAGLILGSLVEFMSELKTFVVELGQPRTASDWVEWLQDRLDSFFDIREDQENEAQVLRDAFNSLGQYADLAGHSEDIGIELITDWVARQLDGGASMRGFLGHGVTFCGIVPMRSVPFRIVCLIGMNDGIFPRIERPASYDLIAREPRRCDRSRRDDDRQAFLECLLNARDVFYLSYVGRDVRDDSVIPPSVLVSELIDYCNRAFATGNGKPAGASLITQHRVQPFSDRYFDDSSPGLFSYASLIAPPDDELVEATDFVSRPLDDAGMELLTLSLDDLTRFFKNPAKEFCSRRLGISYDGEVEEHATEDPVELAGLERWGLCELMLDLLDAGHSRDDALEIVRRGRYAPAGGAGNIALGALMEEVAQVREALQTFRPEGQPAAVNFEFRHGEVTLTGRLDNLFSSGQYRWRQGKTRGADRMALWIRHLVLNVERPPGFEPSSHWCANDGTWHLDPPSDAQAHLEKLLQLYHLGMRRPLPLFPESSWLYVTKLREKRDRATALAEARNKYSLSGHSRQHKEESNPYFERLFRNGVDWEEFEKLAQQAYEPITGYARP